jgi:hypothetical protein
MPTEVRPQDVLMYVNSAAIVRTLPVGDHDLLLGGMQEHGYCTVPAGGSASSHIVPADYNAGDFGGRPVRGQELSEEDQEACLRAWEAVHRTGKTLHIVDVGKESELHRYIALHLHHLRRFPVLVRPDGRRLEGPEAFTEENLARFLSD